jgi:hypothetical protein
MGGDLNEVVPHSYTYGELLDTAFPYYLSIGMTASEFWDGENDLKPAFRKAHKEKLRRENLMMWLQGRYIYDAMLSVYPLFNGLSKRNEPYPYVKEPYVIDDEERKQRERAEAKRKYEKSLADMKSVMKRWNEKLSKSK